MFSRLMSKSPYYTPFRKDYISCSTDSNSSSSSELKKMKRISLERLHAFFRNFTLCKIIVNLILLLPSKKTLYRVSLIAIPRDSTDMTSELKINRGDFTKKYPFLFWINFPLSKSNFVKFPSIRERLLIVFTELINTPQRE